MALEMLLKSFDGIVVRAVRWQVKGADMMPTGIIQHQIDLLFSGWHFLRHGVEKRLNPKTEVRKSIVWLQVIW